MQRLKDWIAPPDPKELVRKWQSSLRTEQRALDRQIRDIQQEEKKLQKSIKEAAKRGDLGIAKNMAREIVQSRKAISRIAVNKAQLMSVSNALTEQLAMLKVSKTLGKSSEVMKMVNTLMKMPELQQTMVEMSKEMMKAGLIDEMMSDAMDSALDSEEVEEEAEEQINQVLDEIMGETLASLPNAKKAQVAKQQQQQQAAEEDVDEDDVAELQARLQAIKS